MHTLDAQIAEVKGDPRYDTRPRVLATLLDQRKELLFRIKQADCKVEAKRQEFLDSHTGE